MKRLHAFHLFAACIGLCFSNAFAAPVAVDMTIGTWVVSGIDQTGTTWDGSTLIFETQTANVDDWDLTGYFEWIGSGGQFGRENFTGTLFADRSLRLDGFELVPPTQGIGVSYYDAELALSNNDIVNGSWAGAGISPSSMWTATRVIPVPAAAWLFASALGLLGWPKRRSA